MLVDIDDLLQYASAATSTVYGWSQSVTSNLLAYSLILLLTGVIIGITTTPLPRKQVSLLTSSSHGDIERNAVVSSTDMRHNRSIISGDILGAELDANQDLAWKARADANTGLTKVFGIQNSFTHTDQSQSDKFKKVAANMLPGARSDVWRNLAQGLPAIINRLLQDRNRMGRLKSLVQNVTLRAAFEVLYGIDASEPEDEDIDQIAVSIEKLWISMKKPDILPEGFELQYKLCAGIKRILKECDFSLNQNPLNFIIPAYETMWRVALLGYCEVLHAKDHQLSEREVWIADLETFLNRPDAKGTGADRIAHQTLRLYPSTRHAYRMLQLEGDREPRMVSVDVQATQRANCSQGEAFAPGVDQDEHVDGRLKNHNFMAFGISKFKCPASPDFGQRMVALLIAAMVHETKDGWALQSKHEMTETGSRCFKSSRDAPNDWELVPIS